MTDGSSTPMPTTLEEVRERYQQEREKRLRSEGLAQFKELKGDYAEFDRDPWADPDFTRDAVVEETEVLIVGGGFAGMLTAVNLTKRGIRSFRIVEKAADFGGTWYWNRYPGCMCDVESYTYMPLLEETGYMPTERYASATEIFEHCQRIGRHFELYDHALFQTEMNSADWDDTAKRWQITTSRGDKISARFMVSASGLLHKAKLPGIPGIETFQGKAFHTSRWDYAYTGGSALEPMTNLAGKRVGIIGTGATAVQAIPQLAKTAAEVFVFQRTPAAVGVRNNGPTDAEWFQSLQPGWQEERMRNFTSVVTGELPERDLVDDGWTKVMRYDTRFPGATDQETLELEQIDFEIMEELRARVMEEIDDPELAEKLLPWYGKHCKRVCFHDGYLPALNMDHVHLVDTAGKGVDEVTPTSVIAAGEEYELDLLIFASGFEVTTGFVRRLGFDPNGRNGVPLSEHWANGAHTLHGILGAEFPNMMIMSTMQASYGTNYVHFLSESANHISWIVEKCAEEGIVAIEPTPEAEDEWLMTLFGVAAPIADYSLNCTPSYYNSEAGEVTEEGMRNVTYPKSLMGYAKYLEEWRDAGDLPGTVTERAG